MSNFGNMMKGRIIQVCGNQQVFVDRVNAALAKSGSKKTIQTSTVSSWCKLTPDVVEAVSNVLGTDCRKFFS